MDQTPHGEKWVQAAAASFTSIDILHRNMHMPAYRGVMQRDRAARSRLRLGRF